MGSQSFTFHLGRLQYLLPGLSLFAALGLALGCANDPLATHGPGETDRPRIIASFSIDESPVLTLSPNERQQLQFSGFDAGGYRVSSGLSLNWSVDDSARLSVSKEGIIHANGSLGLSRVFAEIDGLRDSVAVWIQKPESEPSTFKISLFWSEDVPVWWREAARDAAQSWQRVIRSSLPPVEVSALTDYCGHTEDNAPESLYAGVETGMRVYISTSNFRSGSLIDSVGGPCLNRGLPYPTTVVGRVTLNREMLGWRPVDIEYLAHHEIGHALGLVGVIQGFQPKWLDADEGRYFGQLGLFGHYLDTGEVIDELSFANGAHWPLPELMGSTRSERILHVTVGALMDLGYPAAWYGAGNID